MARTIQVAKHHVEISIRRPNGAIEVVTKPSMNDALFARAAQANKDAGKGELLGWQWVAGTETLSDEDDAADRAESAYNASTAAVYRAMDAAPEAAAVDNTQPHKNDR